MFKEDEPIECNTCGGTNLHQVIVNSYFRNEDDDFVKRTISIKGNFAASKYCKNENSGNPSPRRSGLTVLFICETCEEFQELDVYQHKGSTHIKWRE